jgi:thymidylate synthase
MKAYHDLINRVRTEGDVMPNRTGVDTIKTVGEMFKFDLREGFPILTTKLTYYKAAISETFGFFRGITSAKGFRDLGVKVWDKNANEHGVKPNAWLSNSFREGLDHLGAIYGDQWRNWPGYKFFDKQPSEAIVEKLEKDGWSFLGDINPMHGYVGEVWYKAIDQIADCVRKIIETPEDRRIIFHAWNVAMLDAMALPPCHLLYQFFPNTVHKRLDMVIYVRSNDLCLGAPFNMVGAATVLAAMARVTGYEAGIVSYMIGDAHVYANQHEYLNEQLTKEPYPQPKWSWSDKTFQDVEFGPNNPNWIKDAVSALSLFTAHDIVIGEYQYHRLNTPVPSMVV